MKYLAARLLSGRNQLSRIEKEAILDSVLDRVAAAEAPAESASRPRRRYAVLWYGAPVALAAAGFAVFLLVRPSPPPPGEFTARGGAVSSSKDPDFALRCIDAHGQAPCRSGLRMLFVLSPEEAHPYFAAYAQHPDGTLLWYLPEQASETSIDLRAASQQDVLSTAITLGPEHRPGVYRVHGVFSTTPLSRAAIRAAVSAGSSTSVVVRTKELLLASPIP